MAVITWTGGPTLVSAWPPSWVSFFKTKQGDLDVIVERNEDGSIREIRSEPFGEQFVVLGDPQRCRCLEYRQLVRWSPARVFPPEAASYPVPLPTGWTKQDDGTYTKAMTFESADWIEDTRAVDPAPTVWRYGHRNEHRHVLPGQFSTEEYRGPYYYFGHDRARIAFIDGAEITPGTRVVINVEFKGQILDMQADRIVIQSPPWVWRFDGN